MQNKSGITQRGNSTICRSTSLVGGLLEKALGTYLNAQLDECGDLDVIVGGSSWELLSGKVRDVRVSATKAIYKGVFLTEVDLTASRVFVKPGRKRSLFKSLLKSECKKQILMPVLTAPFSLGLSNRSFRQNLQH